MSNDIALLNNVSPEYSKAALISLRNFRPGDLVRLKCGGPNMVVLQYATVPPGEAERAVCVWHNDNKGICEAAFPECVLDDADPKPLDITYKSKEQYAQLN